MNILKKRWFQLMVVVMLVFLDMITKKMFGEGEGSVINFGGIWGAFQGADWKWLMIVVMLVVVWEWWRNCRVQVQLALVFIMAGGLGNLIDRLLFGGVRDFIYYPVLNVTGNVADIYLTFGLLWLIGLMIGDGIKNRKVKLNV